MKHRSPLPALALALLTAASINARAAAIFGTDFSEPKLLGYGYDFEQATKARVLPRNTPALSSDTLTY